MVKIKKQLVSDTPYKYGRNNQKKYITIHETGNTNKGADAQTHANLQSNGNSRAAAWHWQVDDVQAIQSFTHDFQLWQSGDGRGDGNLNSISVEICVNKDGDYGQAVQNAVELVQHIMDDEDIPASRVVQHNHWSGKDCPRYLRSGEKGPAWNGFVQALGETGGKVEYEPKTKPKQTTPTYTKISGRWTGQTLKKYQKGQPVKELQACLKSKGYLGNKDVDGYYGPVTEAAVREFQKDAGITVDGLAGGVTYAKLLDAADLKVDGKWGSATTRALQKSLGTPVDGILSGQVRNDVTDALYGGLRYGGGGSTVIRALQKKVGSKADGLLGPATVRALQRYLGTPVDGVISRPTSAVVRQMQKQLNKGTF